MKGAVIEILLKLSTDALKAGTAAAGNAVKQMGGVINGSLRKSKAAFQTGITGVRAYREEINRLNRNAGDFKSTLSQVIALVGGGFLLRGAGKASVDFNSTVEQSKIGLAALVRTFNDFPAGVNTYSASMDIASEIQKQLQIEGLKTVATYKQLLVALQEGAGPAFKRGFNPAQVVQFTSLMTQAAAAISLPMDQLGQEIRSILDGTIDRNSRVAKALGITNEKVKEMAESGQLFDYLKGKLEEFAVAGEDMAKTWTGALSNLGDAVQMGLGKGLEGSYNATKQLFLDLRDVIVSIDEAAGTFTFNEKITAALSAADQAISSFIAGITKDDMERYLNILADTFASVIQAIVMFAEAMQQVADALGPALPFLAKWTTAFILFSGALKVLVGLPIIVGKQLLGLNAAFEAMSGGSILLYIKHVQQASQHTGLLKTAFASVPNALASAGALMAAAFAGWQIGTWLYNQFDIVKQAGNRIAATFTNIGLKAKKAWAWVTGGDTDAVQREIDQANQIYKELYNEIGQDAKKAGGAHKEVAKEAKKAAQDAAKSVETSSKMQSKAQKEATDEMKKAYQDYGDTVKKIEDDIAGRSMSLAEQLREMDRGGMSEYGAWKDRKAQAEEYAAAAKKAGEEAVKAVAAGDKETGDKKYAESVELFDKARQAAADLNTELKSGDTVIQQQSTSLEIARDLVKQYGEAGLQAQENYKKAIGEVATALDKQTGGALAKEMPGVAKAFGEVTEQAENLAEKSAEFNRKWNEAWDNMLQDGKKSVAELESDLRELTKDRHIKVYVEEITKKMWGGIIGTAQKMAGGGTVAFRNMLGGGFFPGFGGGDRRHVIAEDGEYMFDKFITRAIGLDAMQTLHAGQFKEFITMVMARFNINPAEILAGFGRKMSLGGMVGRIVMPSLPSPQMLAGGGAVVGGGSLGHYTIDLGVGESSPVRVMADRENAQRLSRWAERQQRLSST